MSHCLAQLVADRRANLSRKKISVLEKLWNNYQDSEFKPSLSCCMINSPQFAAYWNDLVWLSALGVHKYEKVTLVGGGRLTGLNI